MKANEYKFLFEDMITKNRKMGMLLTGSNLLEYEKYDILNHCAYLLQVLHNREVIFVRSENINVDGETPCVCCAESANNFVLGKKPNQAFIVNVNFPYFDKDNSWEMKFIKSLKYYKMPFMGFANEQFLTVYE